MVVWKKLGMNMKKPTFAMQNWAMVGVCALGSATLSCASAESGLDGQNADAQVEFSDATTLSDASGSSVDAGQTQADASVDLFDASTPDAGCVVGPLQLLVNSDFDLGAVNWVENSDGGFAIITNDSEITDFTADTGSFVAWMAGYSQLAGAEDTLHQDIAVPDDATPLEFSGKLFISSAETGVLPFDTLKLQVVNAGTGAVLETLQQWSNLDKDPQWVSFSKTSTGNYAGQTIRVRFVANMDFNNISAFFLDSWSVATASCQ